MRLRCEQCSTEYGGSPGGRFCSKACRLLWENKQINERWEKYEPVKIKPKPKLYLGNYRCWDET